jgi:hypothetical protein
MPCDVGRSTLVKFGLIILLLAPLRLAASFQENSTEQQRPTENAIDRWNRMSPEERERELAKLPPERAKQIRQRIARYNQMHPEEQEALRRRYQTFSQLPPEQKQVIRQRLREFRQLPLARRPVVHRQVEQLRLLPEAQRQAALNSADFHSRFSPQEQQIIRDLSTYLPN